MVCHGSSHDDSAIQRVLEALYKRVLLVLRCFSEAFTDVLQASDRLIAQLYPGFSGDYFNLSCNQEPQSPTGPGDGVEQVRVFLLCDRTMSLLTRTNCSHVYGTFVVMDVVSALWDSNVRPSMMALTKPLADLTALG